MPRATGVVDETAIQATIDRWPERTRRLAAACRDLVLRTIPTSFERPYPGWNAVGFRDPQAGYFCGMFPVAHGLDLVFEHGATLDDPDELFADRPSLRQVRVVEVPTVASLKRPALRALLRRAVVHGSMRRR